MKRIRQALKFNETQRTGAAIISGGLCFGMLSRNDYASIPWWAWTTALLLGPTIAFFSNLKSPLK